MWSIGGVAFAANLREELVRATEPKPELAISCSSAAEVMSSMQRLSSLAGESNDLTKVFDVDLQQIVGATGGFSLSMWGLPAKGEKGDPHGRLTLQTPLGLDEFSALLAAAVGKEVVADGARRKLGTDADVMWIEARDGRIHLYDEVSNPSPVAIDPAVLSVIPETGGCAVAFALKGSDKAPPASLALFAPFRDAAVADPAGMSATFALKLADAKPNQVQRSGRRPVPTSPLAPLAVVQLGLVLDSVDLTELEPEQARVMNYVKRKLPLEGGTVALFAMPPGVAAELPLTKDWSAEKSARKARKLAKKLASTSEQMVVVKTGPTSFDLVAAKPVTVEGVQGGLRVYTSPDLFGPGEPWLTPADVARAGDSHLFLWFDLGQIPSFGLPAGKPMSLSLTADPSGMYSGAVVIPFTLEEFMALGERLGSLAPKR
ncbi:MAG: hypothetical protein ABMA64_35320 [Myxococcota bacterium]